MHHCVVYHFKYINIWLSRCGFTKNPSHWWCTMVYFIDLQVTSDKMPPTLDHQSFKGNFHQARDYYNIFSRTILVFLFLLWFWHLYQPFKLSWYFQFRAFKTDTKRKALRQWTIGQSLFAFPIYAFRKTQRQRQHLTLTHFDHNSVIEILSAYRFCFHINQRCWCFVQD